MSELRPCPQCGNEIRERKNLNPICSSCEMEITFECGDWWCWKEIDSLTWLARSRQKEIDGLKQEVHDLIWNLAGCSLLALGHQVSTVFSKELARPALFDVQKMAKQNEKMREGLNKCLDHWAIVAGPSAYERSTMRILLENALGGES